MMITDFKITAVTDERPTEINYLISALTVHGQNIRNVHWNLQGDLFFEIHQLTGEWYDENNIWLDKLAEHNRTLGHDPVYDLEKIVNLSRVKTSSRIKDAKVGLEVLLTDSYIIQQFMGDLADRCLKGNHHATYHLISKYLLKLNTRMWMMSSFLTEDKE